MTEDNVSKSLPLHILCVTQWITLLKFIQGLPKYSLYLTIVFCYKIQTIFLEQQIWGGVLISYFCFWVMIWQNLKKTLKYEYTFLRPKVIEVNNFRVINSFKYDTFSVKQFLSSTFFYFQTYRRFYIWIFYWLKYM